jgi:hypothetical protein
VKKTGAWQIRLSGNRFVGDDNDQRGQQRGHEVVTQAHQRVEGTIFSTYTGQA